MKAVVSAVLIGAIAATSLAGVRARVYRADEVTPLPWADPNIPDVYQDIMVGTRLTILVGTDEALSLWSGGLLMQWEDWDRGILAGRGYNEETGKFEGSILGASSEDMLVVDNPSPQDMRFTFRVDYPVVGEWLVLDYYALATGNCDVGLYTTDPAHEVPDDFNPKFDDPPPGRTHWLQGLTFNHVPSRDYNDDDVVDFADFALLAGQWRGTVPADPNATAKADLDGDEAVELADLAMFCDYWLERTDIVDPNSEPNGIAEGL